MATKPMQLSVRPRGNPIKNLPDETYVTPSDSGKDLYDRIAAKSRFPINRLRITKGSDGSYIQNTADASIESLGLYEQSTVFVKDLGPQIAWRTVFIVEYLGPLLLHTLIYSLRSSIYQSPNKLLTYPSASFAQQLSYTMIMVHFTKRECETVFVHRFSASTMPIFNLFKNSAHYWLLAGLNIALFTYSPSIECPTSHPIKPYIAGLAIALFGIGEVGNLSAHLTLRGLRSSGGGERGIPISGVFRYVPVTCPNYFFETLAWIGIWLANRSLSTGLFSIIAVGQMAVWARKKESRYRKEFGKDIYKRKRFAMIPGII